MFCFLRTTVAETVGLFQWLIKILVKLNFYLLLQRQTDKSILLLLSIVALNQYSNQFNIWEFF